MRRVIFLAPLVVMAVVLAWAQRPAPRDPYELKLVFPREVTPARYEQVEPRELQILAEQGWELVSVMPYIYRNEERGAPELAPRPMVTQTYPAYFFKRLKVNPPR
jgi:hypothetical protein